jgi:hypothetical protein
MPRAGAPPSSSRKTKQTNVSESGFIAITVPTFPPKTGPEVRWDLTTRRPSAIA